MTYHYRPALGFFPFWHFHGLVQESFFSLIYLEREPKVLLPVGEHMYLPKRLLQNRDKTICEKPKTISSSY